MNVKSRLLAAAFLMLCSSGAKAAMTLDMENFIPGAPGNSLLVGSGLVDPVTGFRIRATNINPMIPGTNAAIFDSNNVTNMVPNTTDFLGWSQAVITIDRPDMVPFKLVSFDFGSLSGPTLTASSVQIEFTDGGANSGTTGPTVGAGNFSPGASFAALELNSLTLAGTAPATMAIGVDNLVFDLVAVPEPSSMLALISCGIVTGFRRRRSA